jgi:uncharacterized protein (TIRG00374 family)
VPLPLGSTSIGESLTSFSNAASQFFSDLAAVRWLVLLVALACFALNLTLRSRAYFNTLRAAYPAVSFQWRRIWGAYVAAVGFNNVVPARGGDIIKLFLTRSSVPGSSYPTVASAFFVEAIFDACVGVFVLIFAFTRGVFPNPPDFSKLSSFDISYLAEHFRFTLFSITLLAVIGLVAFAILSVRLQAFWARVRQGVTILSDRRRYLREVVSLQAVAWICRFAAFWFLLEAFRVGASVENVLLVFGVGQVAGAVPFTPGGAGVQQALLVKVFAGAAPTAVIAAYSVGQQIAIATFTALLGLGAVVFIFRFRSFGEVLHAGRASRQAERAAEARARSEANVVGANAVTDEAADDVRAALPADDASVAAAAHDGPRAVAGDDAPTAVAADEAPTVARRAPRARGSRPRGRSWP